MPGKTWRLISDIANGFLGDRPLSEPGFSDIARSAFSQQAFRRGVAGVAPRNPR